MSNNRLAIVGAGGFAAEVVEAAVICGWKIHGLFDDDSKLHGTRIMDCLCLGRIDKMMSEPPFSFVLAIGSNKVRCKLAEQLSGAGHCPVSIIHPTATVSQTAKVEEGAYIGADAFIGPHVVVGSHAIVNVHTSIGHDAKIGAFSQICPGARVSGYVKIDQGGFLGSNASVAPHLRMGEWSCLSANSFLHRSIPSRVLAVGVPARVVADA